MISGPKKCTELRERDLQPPQSDDFLNLIIAELQGHSELLEDVVVGHRFLSGASGPPAQVNDTGQTGDSREKMDQLSWRQVSIDGAQCIESRRPKQ